MLDILLLPWASSRQPKPRRPSGVTILGILSILAGLGGIIVGAGALALSGLAASAYPGGAPVAAGIRRNQLFILVLESLLRVGLFVGNRMGLSFVFDPCELPLITCDF